MMLYPPVADLVGKVGSSYRLVNLVAKRARAISAEAETSGEPLTKKAVSAAIEEVYTGKLTVGGDEPAPAEEETVDEAADIPGDDAAGDSDGQAFDDAEEPAPADEA